jgi:hypothetical protein
VLIYGSASEFDERPELRSKRKEMAPNDTFLMTFDHLRPDANADDFMTIRRDGCRVTALTVPPTYRLRPITTGDILEVQGRIEAVQREPRLTEVRRRFLIERIPYWDAWLRRDKRGVIVSSDCE